MKKILLGVGLLTILALSGLIYGQEVVKVTKISDTELEFEREPEKYIMTKEVIEKRLAHFRATVIEYENLLKKFN